jgi:hypothetical protein
MPPASALSTGSGWTRAGSRSAASARVTAVSPSAPSRIASRTRAPASRGGMKRKSAARWAGVGGSAHPRSRRPLPHPCFASSVLRRPRAGAGSGPPRTCAPSASHTHPPRLTPHIYMCARTRAMHTHTHNAHTRTHSTYVYKHTQLRARTRTHMRARTQK